MTEERYLADQITKRVREILSEAMYNNYPFRNVNICIDWNIGDKPLIEYRYTRGECEKLHRSLEECEAEE